MPKQGGFTTASGKCSAQGQLAQALDYFDKALAIGLKLGAAHPDTIKTYKSIADVYDKQGEDEKAMEVRAKIIQNELVYN